MVDLQRQVSYGSSDEGLIPFLPFFDEGEDKALGASDVDYK